MAVLAQPWSTMPTASNGSALGWEALKGVDWTDIASVEAAVSELMTTAMQRSPLVWHRGRRHAPTPSAVCSTHPAPSPPPSRIYVGGVDMYLEQAGTNPVLTHIVDAPGGLSFAHRGFSWGLIGTPTCVCAESTSQGLAIASL